MNQAFLASLKSNEIYTPETLDNLISHLPVFDTTRTKKVDYLEAPAAFDLEASSFLTNAGEKAATMYVWTFGIFGFVVLGRTWGQFCDTLSRISAALHLGESRRLVCGVHNLAYDFQFFRKWLTWDKVFSTDHLKPLYAISDLGIEFRCTYRLSGYSLAKLGENLKTYHWEKAVGDLDYSIPRHYDTPLIGQETGYVVSDNKVVQAYLMECIEDEGSITKVPLTKTGYVRRYARTECFGPTKETRAEYQRIIRRLTVTPDEYLQLKRAFQGGFTHGNPLWVGKVAEYAESWDFTSSYPAAIVSGKFPMGKGEVVQIRNRKQFYYNLREYCCIFDIEFEEIESTFVPDNYISFSRCLDENNKLCCNGARTCNGRVISAKRLRMTVTELDFNIIRKTYKWKHMRIGTFRRYKKEYLPTPFVRAVLFLYAEKTRLKGVEGEEETYMKLKELLNSCYGMCVTDIAKEIIAYFDNMWDCEKPLEQREQEEAEHREAFPEILADLINKYNKNWNRFLFYPWGVYITAIARARLWTGILACGNDYLYSDTDSIKIVHPERHRQYFEDYNRAITEDINRACDYHGIPREMASPKTVKGEVKPLGVWDFDGAYRKFKTNGAKRYIVQYSADPRNGKKARHASITVSGLNKETVTPWLYKVFRTDYQVFQAFNDKLNVPAEYTGKLTHTYINTPIACQFTDYRGVTVTIQERSCVHMTPAPYSMGIEEKFMRYVKGIQEGAL